MFNLSLTACSFHFRKTNSKRNTQVYDLNAPLCIKMQTMMSSNFPIYQNCFVLFLKSMKRL